MAGIYPGQSGGKTDKNRFEGSMFRGSRFWGQRFLRINAFESQYRGNAPRRFVSLSNPPKSNAFTLVAFIIKNKPNFYCHFIVIMLNK